ncbi:MAG: 4'-phosphopantetheinyl transferase superfamily protein [Rhodospirillales bacterium]|nr:4'-phosphopantetheinyl transferase superfamily protein [Rhodospirillales bacterium]
MSEHRVFLWWLETGLVETAAWQPLGDLLAQAERERAGRFHFERDRESYIAAHALGRVLLSSVAGGDPRSWRFTIHDHGKPELVSPSGGPRWRLNLSHTRGLAAAALTPEFDIGVDAECLKRTPNCAALSRRFFAPEEAEFLKSVPADRELETFLAFWTLKESYVKAIGKGLAQPLDSFYFTFDPLRIHFAAADGGDPLDWQFYRHQPSDAHLLALSLRHRQSQQVAIQTRAVRAQDLLKGQSGSEET